MGSVKGRTGHPSSPRKRWDGSIRAPRPYRRSMRKLPAPPAPPTPEDFTSPVHDRTVVARMGALLGIAFTLCFLTGVLSHLHQNPIS